jgi:hypothetical protein
MEEFWAKVEKGPGDACWPWIGNHLVSGYGRFSIGTPPQRQRWLAHRMAWTLEMGPIPTGMVICHHCDNPGCVNPKHLFLGSHADNVLDMHSKGRNRQPKGINHWKAKLTEIQIISIRNDPRPNAIIGRIYNIAPNQILMIKRRTAWKHI